MSQAAVAEVMNREFGLAWYPSTVAKIEAGNRDIKIDELFALAEYFRVSTDALLGRPGRGTNVMWATARLSGNAQKIATDISTLRTGLEADIELLSAISDGEHKQEASDPLVKMAYSASGVLQAAADVLRELGTQFPLPGVSFER